jgi:dihydrofolate reductase/thymidylate synthase
MELQKINVNLIVAIDSKYGIGKNNKIPWEIKEDYWFFQDNTKKKYLNNSKNIVIYGKNTWKSLSENCRGLQDRINLIISSTMTDEELSNENTSHCEAFIYKTINNAFEDIYNQKFGLIGKVFICGGKNIYEECIKANIIDEVYLTHIHYDYNCTTSINHDVFHNFINKFVVSRKYTFNLEDKILNTNINVSFSKLTISKENSDNVEETNYLDLLYKILTKGHYRKTRNEYTYSTFGNTLEFDLNKGFPLLTTKKVFFNGVVEELLWFLRGDTNSKNLVKNGVKIWEPNTSREFLDSMKFYNYEEGDIGPMYGFQWRNFNAEYKGMNENYSGQGYDQLKYCIELIKKDPYSRRILMTSYNPEQVGQGVLYPCHGISVIFNIEDGNKLSCMMTQRSVDMFLGAPFNIASYALLIHMICEVINNDPNYTGNKLKVGRLIMSFADTHIYRTHYSECVRQILREPIQFPQILFKNKVTKIDNFTKDDFEIVNYNHYPTISAKMIA